MNTHERIHKIVKDIICDRAVYCKDCDADETCAFKGIFKDLAAALAKEVVFRDEVIGKIDGRRNCLSDSWIDADISGRLSELREIKAEIESMKGGVYE